MAVSQSDILAVNQKTGAVLVDGAMNQAFPDAQTGTGTDYAYIEIQNRTASGLSWSAGKAWLLYDLNGATITMGVADGGTARATTYDYGTVTLPTFSGPSDYASGLTLPTLAPNQKCLLVIKRDTTGASVTLPERNVLVVQGTSPI